MGGECTCMNQPKFVESLHVTHRSLQRTCGTVCFTKASKVHVSKCTHRRSGFHLLLHQATWQCALSRQAASAWHIGSSDYLAGLYELMTVMSSYH